MRAKRRGEYRDRRLLHTLSQGGLQQGQLANSAVCGDQFRQGAARPTAARQLGVQRRKPAAEARLALPRQLVSPPDVRALENRLQRVQGLESGRHDS